MEFELTKNNYFSRAASKKYMSSSQYHTFLDCEAMAMAEIEKEWVRETTDPMLAGSYVHAYYEGTKSFKKFKEEHPELFSSKGATKGELKAIFKTTCNAVIQRIDNDKLFMKSLEGQKEVIFTAELFGIDWKVLIDAYNPDEKRLADLKILKSLYDKFWKKELGYQNVFDARGYFTQISIYAEVERLANGRAEGDYFEPFISIATKEKYPDLAIVSFNSEEMPYRDFICQQLSMVENNIDRVIAVKKGEETPIRCEICDYCRSTKVLAGTRHFTDFNLY